MPDRFKYSEVRQKIINALRTDLMGPQSENEILDENPKSSYIIGMLASQTEEKEASTAGEQEVDSDIAYGDSEDYTAGEDDDNEPIMTTSFKLPTSIGISFYIASSTKTINIDVKWGDYVRSVEKRVGKDGKEYNHASYTRQPMSSTIVVDFDSFEKNTELRLQEDSNVIVHISRIPLKTGYSLVTAYVMNRRKNSENEVESMMFQVELKAYSENEDRVFFAENICRDVLAEDEFYFEQRPILGRGRNCAATWDDAVEGRTFWVKSDFIPEYEFPGVSAALKGFDKFFFSMRFMSNTKNKAGIFERLNVLADSYGKWIHEKLISDDKMSNADFKEKIGDKVISHCSEALNRIREGIELIANDEVAFDAFCFMNRSMLLQRNIMSYSKKHGAGIECNFRDFVDPRKPDTDFGWRPFQIAFILMNLSGIVNPEHKDRDVVDLLYFPTGGGKTEAYLGLMAFVIANRRLRASDASEYNADGGVTAMLRYTLRLLTTQQRDRITKMVVAAELIRQKTYPKYGKEPISIGFWVGGGVTPNKFDELVEKADKPGEARRKRNLLYKQLLTCPFCGKPLTEDEFYIDPDRKSVAIYCADRNCMFYKYKQDRIRIPVYLVDEEIYAKCPTIILSTVDKFARLPWDVKTNALFGRVDRVCSRDGYVAIGEEHKRHNRTQELPASTLTPIRPFLPPELIIQDELHLITGPLGTVYGAYETIIEDMCTYGDKRIKPKYVVSTATIKNASEQTRCLYARQSTAQFPPNGFEIGDSFFINEISTKDDPFRKYVGVCAPGQSVKTTLLRMYIELLKDVMGDDGVTAAYNKYFADNYTRTEFDEALTRRLSNITEFKEIKQMEYDAITHHNDPAYASNKKHFKAEEDSLPAYLKPYFSRVIRITRLREVKVLLGFTRVDAPDPDADVQANVVYLNKGKSEKWLPAAEVNGEGVFIEFNKETLEKWLAIPSVKALSRRYEECYEEFCNAKGWTLNVKRNATYVLMHTFAHLLIKQMSMTSGYSSSAIRERIYFSEKMTGILLYTGSADKEGSLGGLVELGNIGKLVPLMKDAFQEALLCTNDPECMSNAPAGKNLNGAACHSCCMISETACENGNRMLDRGLVVPIACRERESYFRELVCELCQLEM